MALTPAQVRVAMIPLVRALLKAGHPVIDFAGVGPDLGQFVVMTPAGYAMPVTMPIRLASLIPLPAFVADAESRIRVVLAPFETELAAGFLRSGRTLQPGEPGRVLGGGWT
jgi:hypothetical protein